MNRFVVVAPLALAISIVSSLGQSMLKLAMNRVPAGLARTDALAHLLRIGWFYAGFATCVVGVLAWLYLMSLGDLSYVSPFLGMSFIVVMLVSVLVLHEDVSALRAIGTVVIALGVALVARS